MLIGLTYIQDIPESLNSFPIIAWRPIPLRDFKNAYWCGVCYRHNHKLHPYVCFTAYRHNIDDNSWAEGSYYDTMEEALYCFAKKNLRKTTVCKRTRKALRADKWWSSAYLKQMLSKNRGDTNETDNKTIRNASRKEN